MSGDRPSIHVTPDRGWLNDPNGLTFWQGRHHVFHQHDPDSLWFGRMSWGHVSSVDLVHWRRHPVALTPGAGPDRDGVWSGCVVDDGGVATAVYTGVVDRPDGSRIQTVCLATSTDPELETWVKDPANPVPVEPPPVPVEAFRDPYVWREGDGWAMLLGTGLPDGHGGLFLYRSVDLRDWRYQGVFVSGADLPPDAPWSGTVWECPNLALTDAGTALLLVSAHDPGTRSLHHTVALLGSIEHDRFVPSSARRFDDGHNCYATAIEQHPDGRVIAWGWAWEALHPADREHQGWAGCLTLPRELTVDGETLVVRPARELAHVASPVETMRGTDVTPNSPLEVVLGDPGRVDARLRLDHTSVLRLAVRHSPSSGERLLLEYSPARGTIVVDRDGASTRAGALGGVSTAAHRLSSDGLMSLTVIVDRSVVEIFVDDRLSFTERIYPAAADADRVRIEAGTDTFSERPASIYVESLTVSQFASVAEQPHPSAASSGEE